MRGFFPVRYIDVDASPPHGPGTRYRVAVGTERWDEQGDAADVFKIQMVHHGRVSSRRSPSYPKGSDDLDRVMDALQRLREGHGARGGLQPAAPEEGLLQEAIGPSGPVRGREARRAGHLAELRRQINEAFEDPRPSISAEDLRAGLRRRRAERVKAAGE